MIQQQRVSSESPQGSRDVLKFTFRKPDSANLEKLPWHKPLSEWKEKEVNFILVKSGLSRHAVRFVKIRGKSFAIKETSGEVAEREFHAYCPLLVALTGIPVRRSGAQAENPYFQLWCSIRQTDGACPPSSCQEKAGGDPQNDKEVSCAIAC
jgi:hypothetical protein